MGTKYGEEGRFRLNRLARPGTMAPRGVVNGKSYEPEPVKGSGMKNSRLMGRK